VTSSTTPTKQPARRLPLLATATAALLAALPALADTAHTVRPGWGEWWLPYNYAKHGEAIDGMFVFIFWLTTIVLIVVQVVLVYFLFKYKHDPAKAKGKFIHGNTRLEMIWTLIPAVILAVLALASKRIWDRYRYAEDYDNTPQTEILVIGEQFKWNVVYPGKDGKFGQYLAYPHPSDPKFRSLGYQAAMKAINEKYMIENPLGQDQNWSDSEAAFGKDDDYDRAPGRPIILPVEQPIAVRLSSKDVIHDFFLPNFRVKLDALPGMMGRLNFTAMQTAQSTEKMSIDDDRLIAAAKKLERKDGDAFKIWIDSNTHGAMKIDSEEVSQVNYALKAKDGSPVIKSREDLSLDKIAALKAAGITEVTAITKPFELVCEELCGGGHYSMKGVVYFVSPAEYKAFIDKDPPKYPESPSNKGPGVASASATK
jgi:heme/copper-type cytochrome/quinol oxidase subunit 2